MKLDRLLQPVMFLFYGFGASITNSESRYNSNYDAMFVDATKEYINYKFIARGSVLITMQPHL